MNKVKVKRQSFEMKGKQYYSYFLIGTIHGKEEKIGIKPPDVGGYRVLDIFFEGKTEPTFTATPFEMKTEDGRMISGNTYSVQSVDEETGEVFSCKVRPARESDKTMLAMLLS